MMSMGRQKQTVTELIKEYRVCFQKVVQLHNVVERQGGPEEVLNAIEQTAHRFAALCDLFICIQRTNQRRRHE